MQSEPWSSKQKVYCEWGRLASLSLKSMFGYEEKENYTSDPNTCAFQYTGICAQKTHKHIPVSSLPGSQTCRCLEWYKESFGITALRAPPRLSWDSPGEKAQQSDCNPIPRSFWHTARFGKCWSMFAVRYKRGNVEWGKLPKGFDSLRNNKRF